MVTGEGVGPHHVRLRYDQGLVIEDLGAGPTVVNGRERLAAKQSVTVAGVQVPLSLGSTPVDLATPAVLSLFVERSELPLRGDLIRVGRDPAAAHIVVADPRVSAAHLEIDVASRSVKDLESSGKTLDRFDHELPAGRPVPLDETGGYHLAKVWLPTRLLLAVAAAPAAALTRTKAASAEDRPAASLEEPLRPSRTIFGSVNVKAAPAGVVAVVGRRQGCDIVLPIPQLSASHATVALSPEGDLTITDLASTNGTFVDGRRLAAHEPVTVKPGAKVFFGPCAVTVDRDEERIFVYVDKERPEWIDNAVELEGLDLTLTVPDRQDRQKDKVLLDKITFKARPGDFIALMGPSGAGKTTLLTVLNGYRRPSAGEVRVNGVSLGDVYDALRGSIGYVPQDDILHPELTVREAISYSARFRLPPDTSDEELGERVDQTISALGLQSVQHLQIGKPERKILSGGQRKRVNIALELVNEPALMFLDEPTSGLAADDTVALIDLLAKLAKERGNTIIVTIHQPAREEYEKFKLALILGTGGVPLYYGPTGRASYRFFERYLDPPPPQGIDNPRDMFAVLTRREQDILRAEPALTADEAKRAAAAAWHAEFFDEQNPVYARMYLGLRKPGKAAPSVPPARPRVKLWRQLRLLTQRYALTKLRDRVGLTVLLLQAPLIGALLAAVYRDPRPATHAWCRARVGELPPWSVCDPSVGTLGFNEVTDHAMPVFLVVIVAIWFGTSNAAREIVAEQAIFRRERMVNLSVLSYLASKFTLLSLLAAVQCALLLAIVYPSLGLGGGDWIYYPTMLATLVVAATCASAIGLLISASVSSSEGAVGLTPLALIPQIVLGGRMVPMTDKSWFEWVMAAVPARWAYEGLLAAERHAVNRSGKWNVRLCDGSAERLYHCAIEELRDTAEGLGGLGFTSYRDTEVHLLVLAGMTVLVLAGVAALLRAKD